MSLSNYPPGVSGNEWQITGPPDDELIYADIDGAEIALGDLVCAEWAEKDLPDHLCGTEEHAQLYGTVTELHAPEGDVGDEGRSIEIPGRCVVEFYGGDAQNYHGHTKKTDTFTWHCYFEDLTLVKKVVA